MKIGQPNLQRAMTKRHMARHAAQAATLLTRMSQTACREQCSKVRLWRAANDSCGGPHSRGKTCAPNGAAAPAAASGCGGGGDGLVGRRIGAAAPSMAAYS